MDKMKKYKTFSKNVKNIKLYCTTFNLASNFSDDDLHKNLLQILSSFCLLEMLVKL